MVATNQRTLNDVLIKDGKRRTLPAAVLYGPNASGKSNVVAAMAALCAIIRRGTIANDSFKYINEIALFPFIHDNNDDPFFFETEFTNNEKHYIYTLEIYVPSLKKNGERFIKAEKLVQILQGKAESEIILFYRTKDKIIIEDNNLKLFGFYDSGSFKVLLDNIEKNIDNHELFLTGSFKSIIQKSIADDVVDFFLLKVFTAIDFQNAMSNFRFDLDNLKLKLVGKLLNEYMWSVGFLDEIVKVADFGPQEIGMVTTKGQGNSDSEFRMYSKYRGAVIPSQLIESGGTLRLLQFSFLLKSAVSSGMTLLIDEMDNSLHPEIIKEIISLFNNPNINELGAQLIFTSHNPVFMDKDLLRRDQLLFVEKDPDTFESTLHSLADFGSVSVRNDQAFMKNYFKGRYGKLPFLDLESVLRNELKNEIKADE